MIAILKNSSAFVKFGCSKGFTFLGISLVMPLVYPLFVKCMHLDRSAGLKLSLATALAIKQLQFLTTRPQSYKALIMFSVIIQL